MEEGKIVTGSGGPSVQSQAVTPSTETPTAPPPVQNSESSIEDGVISWTASEFISHEKTGGWYGILVLVTVIAAAMIYLLTRDIISTTVAVICGVAFGAVAGRRPRQLQYRISNSGVTIGQKHLPYTGFKSFSVVPEGAFSSIVFRPLKRFSPLTTIYYSPNDEDNILDMLSQHLPFEEHRPDAVDSVMRRIRF